MGHRYDGDKHEYTDSKCRALILVNNYTTYDLRRAQDSLNPHMHANVMVTAQEDPKERNGHLYWYARIVRVFHAYIQHVGPLSKNQEPQRVEFLWVCWFGRDMTAPAGFRPRQLHRIGFVDGNDPFVFGFLDSSQVIPHPVLCLWNDIRTSRPVYCTSCKQ